MTLARKLARWASDNFDALAACNPPLPPGAFNRLADNWRPLLAIAQIAGGDWPARALDAFAKLAAPRPSPLVLRPSTAGGPTLDFGPKALDSSLPSPTLDFGHKTLDCGLLSAIRQLFTQSGRDRISSQDLVAALCRLNAPRSTLHAQLTPARLSRLLAPFGINPRTLRIDGRCPRGYRLADFAKAFDRFLNDAPKTETSKA